MLDYIVIFVISMLPIVELRGAIPVGAGVLPFGIFDMQLDILPNFLLCVLGNLLPIPFLILFGGKVLHYFASFEKFGKPFRKIIEVGEKKVAKMSSKAQTALFWGLFTFVAIPLPGTGGWTGALIAITLGLNLKKAFPPIALGVATAGVIMTLASYGLVSAFNVFL